MNKIEKLIAELCPDGVEFKELQELFHIKNGYTPSKKNPDYWTDGTIPWFRMDDIRQNGRILYDSLQHVTPQAVKNGVLFPADSIIIATTATIGEHALITVDSLANQRFTFLTQKVNRTLELDMKFIFYYGYILGEWCRNNTHAASFASVNMNKFKRFRVPIPPLEVQHEIVRILDTFSELEAELEARRKQYQYYRDQLLSFETGPKVRWMSIGEFGELVRGNGMPKSDFVEQGVGCIHYGQIYTHYGTWTTETISYVSPEKAKRLAKVDPGDLIITNTSEDVGGVCKAVAWIGNSQIVTGGHATVLKHNQNSKYISYYMQTQGFFIEKKKRAMGAKVIDVSAKNLAKIKIPVPPLEIQHEIVKILDKFDALVNDLSIGLPAEINARRKQYEYYRDRLLTFKEAA